VAHVPVEHAPTQTLPALQALPALIRRIKGLITDSVQVVIVPTWTLPAPQGKHAQAECAMQESSAIAAEHLIL
jgi:hypothetical protein